MYGIQGEPHYTRQRREDIRTEVSRSRGGKKVSSGVFGAFAKELMLDSGRVVALVTPPRRKKGAS